MFAGLYPTNIDASKQIWLVDLFNKLDFNTVIFSENPGVQKSFTFANGFQNYMEDYPFEKIISAEYNINKTIRSELLYQVKNWIINSKKRFFCYLHLLLPHNPYFPPEPFNNKFLPNIYDKSLKPTTENLVKIANNEIAISPLQREYIISQYDANLFYADYIVGYLLDELKKQKVLSRTVVIITSDHGEAFGEHKLWLHCHSCYNEMLRIPLIFYFPQSAKIKDIKLNFRVGLIDIMPTLHELFGFNAKSNYDGINLLPFFSGLKKPKERVIIGESTTQISAMLGSFKLIRTFRSFQNFKLPQPDTEQLFDLESDYNENSDVSALYPEVTLLLKKLIDMYNEKKPNSNSIKEKLKNIDKITLERLRSLGYIR